MIILPYPKVKSPSLSVISLDSSIFRTLDEERGITEDSASPSAAFLLGGQNNSCAERIQA